jgi:Kef-type K+ transport system membrane component KefB
MRSQGNIPLFLSKFAGSKPFDSVSSLLKFMSVTIENILLIGSILLIISVIAGKTSYKFGVPVLIFFLGIGMLAGSEGIGGIHFDNPAAAQFIGIVALNFILFSGGMDTDWRSVKPILRRVSHFLRLVCYSQLFPWACLSIGCLIFRFWKVFYWALSCLRPMLRRFSLFSEVKILH